MVLYLDTSALLPLLLAEKGSSGCLKVWQEAHVVFASRLLHVETVAALGAANRQGRLPDKQVEAAISQFGFLWDAIRPIEADQGLIERAGEIAWQFGLRGYDAVHCASAHLLYERTGVNGGERSLIVASGDHALLSACDRLGLSTFDPTA